MVAPLPEPKPINKRNGRTVNAVRQDRKTPFLIRDDGMLYPNVPLVAANPRFRPYHGNLKASLQDRLRFLKGLDSRRTVVYDQTPPEPFNLGKASLDEIIEFARNQFGAVLDPAKPLSQLRDQVWKLSLAEQGQDEGGQTEEQEGDEQDNEQQPETPPSGASQGLQFRSHAEATEADKTAVRPSKTTPAAKRPRGRPSRASTAAAGESSAE